MGLDSYELHPPSIHLVRPSDLRRLTGMVAHANPVVVRSGRCLPVAVTGEREAVSAEAAAEIAGWMKPAPIRFVACALRAWAAIVIAIWAAERIGTWWSCALAIIFIATRQNVLGLLMHEQAHRLGFKSEWGGRLANVLVAYPILMTVEQYRGVHLTHHRHFFTEKDPDYLRKQGPDWTFPQSPLRFARMLFCDLIGLNFFKVLRSKRLHEPSGAADEKPKRLERLAFYAVAIAALTYFHLWPIAALYWFVPILTVLQVFVRWGAICEHKYDLIAPSLAESTAVIRLTWWEKLLFPNLNFTYHLYHHFYPRIPSHLLPRVHERFRREGLVRDEHVFHGYFSYLRHLLKAQQPRTASASVTSAEPVRA